MVSKIFADVEFISVQIFHFNIDFDVRNKLSLEPNRHLRSVSKSNISAFYLRQNRKHQKFLTMHRIVPWLGHSIFELIVWIFSFCFLLLFYAGLQWIVNSPLGDDLDCIRKVKSKLWSANMCTHAFVYTHFGTKIRVDFLNHFMILFLLK